MDSCLMLLSVGFIDPIGRWCGRRPKALVHLDELGSKHFHGPSN